MGCAQSKIENEESVSRCKDRKILMKEAVAARNAFAAGHSGYAVFMKSAGAALSDFAQGESDESPSATVLAGIHPHALDPASEPRPPPPPPPIDALPPSPPPLPIFSPSPLQPLKRSVTMPEIPMKLRRNPNSIAEEEEEEEEENDLPLRRPRKGASAAAAAAVTEVSPAPLAEVKAAPPPMPESKGMAWDYFFNVDSIPGSSLEENREVHENDNVLDFIEEEEELEEEKVVEAEAEPKTPEKASATMTTTAAAAAEEEMTPVMKTMEHSKTLPVDFMRVGNAGAGPVGPRVSLVPALNQIDDHFLKASEGAQEVSMMLEATRLHYHSNFADNRGHIDHSARVMRVITWNRSFKGIPGDGGKEEFDSEEHETHATVLDKMLAWEKKLYDEVKQGELMKLEYKRKVAQLNKQRKRQERQERQASAESLEKLKAAVSHLHTRYIVDMQSMDSTVSEVNRLRDEQLYPKLVALADGMAKMWQIMSVHHDSQLKIVTDLKALDLTHSPKETTKHHHERTIQLHHIVQDWHSQFEKLVVHQKQYIHTLNGWLKLNLVPIESSLKEKISSPPRPQHPPIQSLLHSWNDLLDKLPDELAKSAISSFGAVIKTIILHQEEEMKLKEKCEETRKEYLRKSQGFEDWYQKYMNRRGPEEMDPERGEDANPKDPVSERQFAVESLKKRLEEEIETHQRHCLQVREKSLGSLKTRLPEIFRAMSDYSHACADGYHKLRSGTKSQRSNGVPNA